MSTRTTSLLTRATTAALLLLASAAAGATTVTTFSPQGEVSRIRQVRATFSESMVRFGDPKLPAPFDARCAQAGTGRWVDDKTWVYDFSADLAAGTRCSFNLKPGLKALDGTAVTGTTSYEFSTGGPAVVRAYPWAGEGQVIEEEQAFALLLNGPATPVSIEKYGYCAIAGVGERVPLKLLTGQVSDAIIDAVGLKAQRARVVTVRCARPLPNDTAVEVVWGKGIATPSGVPNSADRRLAYKVRAPFTASFTCERENARANCLPIKPLRIEFSSPVPRALAARIMLKAPDGEHKPRFEQAGEQVSERLVEVKEGLLSKFLYFFKRDKNRASDDPSANAVSAIEFPPPFAENTDIRIELPKDLADDAGRKLANASLFPLATRISGMPPLAKFASDKFGVLELNAEPLLPVTVRHVEADLNVQGLTVSGGAVRDLRLSDDASIIDWMARIAKYQENTLKRQTVESELGIRITPPKPRDKNGRKAKRYGADEEEGEYEEDPDRVQTRTVSLLKREQASARLALPAAGKDAKGATRPFEVIGIPLPEPGFYVVELESPRLGAALLDRNAPMYVRTTTLVTNLGVHFKHGPVNSGVWVTTLDKGKPVGDAQVQISDCQGQVQWTGRTDAKGYAKVAKELPRLDWEYCRSGEEGSYREQGYFVSARKADAKGRIDMAFVWSTWNEGIESWRFHVDTSGQYAPPTQQLFHTVFDRTLLRAGQTVSMKHIARSQKLAGLGLLSTNELPNLLRIVHQGSGQKFEFPLSWRGARSAENTFAIPADAKLGLYDVALVRRTDNDDHGNWSTGSFRVEEFRLPVMTGRIVPPKAALISPKDVPLDLQVSYGNGGGASGLPVQVSAQLREVDLGTAIRSERFPGFRFEPPREPRDPNAKPFFSEDYVDEDDAGNATRTRGDARNQLVANKLAVTLDRNGAGKVNLAKLPEVKTPRELLVQATYADPNGEVQTLSQTLPVWPSAVVLGVRTDSWVSVKQKLPAQVIALDTAGKPQANVDVAVRAVLHRTTSVRKRLVGGFYAYDNQDADEDLGQVCRGKTDSRGLLFCEAELKEAGNVELVAEARDNGGHVARAASSLWVTRQGEIWFGGDNQDRIDLIPEQRSYQPGETAKFQVRMPFRHATALVSVERNGILDTQVVELDGRDPTVSLKVQADWGPNVYVSVLAVRGRIREVPWYSFFTWGWRAPSEWWSAWRNEGQLFQAPTAMVDLSKPAFKLGIAEIEVGTASHQLKVEVTPDKQSYPIRATSQVRIQVTLPDGKPAPAGTEVALAAVDEALLELMPNGSWNLLDAMIRRRAYGMETATAQMQIIGKRHYGQKAVAAGGGGGQFPTRELFDTLLLWNPRVVLDAKGQAVVNVPLNDALTSFRIVAVADAVQGGNAALFGTGRASIRATQDLQIVSGLPPLVREGDRYRAMFTLRNTTAKPMDVTLNAQMGATALAPLKLRIDANAAADTGWDVAVPYNLKQLEWTVSAESAAARDRMKLPQQVGEAVPVTVQQATLMQLDKSITLPIAAPKGALPNEAGALRGGIEVGLKPRLADGLPGVRDYFQRYPWFCLEQRASIAVGLRDVAAWRAITAQLPLYLDEEGLANYFPPRPGDRNTGSDTLTAYLLSISDEATRAGVDFSLPDDLRNRMEKGLLDFVQGRIKREFWMPAFLKNGDLDVRKLAALEALSRRGKVQPALLDSIQVLPNQWPTGAVIDWLQVLDRTPNLPERDKRMAEAEQVLRARLNVQGTRFGFSTERDDSWWWLMSNGDVNSVRIVLAVLARPQWQADLPKIVTGTLQRQQHGAWSTTVSNAWGSLAVEAFSKRFEKDPVNGSTRVGYEPAGVDTPQQSFEWSRQPSGGSVALGWPPGFAVGGKTADTNVKLTHEGSGKPWVTFISKAAVPLTAPFNTGFAITKTVEPVEQKVKGKWSRGDVLRVKVEVDAQADMTWVVLNDPVPAGSTLLGNGLGRDDAIETDRERSDWRGWLAYEERRFDAFRAYYRYVPKGKFSVEYTVRLNNPGSFGLPQTRVEAMYAPEMFGEWPNAQVVVQP